MPQTAEFARRWNAYVCPDCRFIFRVPREYEGTGLVCPACRRMLRLPVEGDLIPPVVIPPTKTADVVIPDKRDMRRKQSRRRSQQEANAEPVWERSKAPGVRSAGRESRMILWAGASVLLAVVLVLLLWRPGRQQTQSPAAPVVPPPPETGARVAPGKETETVRDVKAFMDAAKPVAQKFLEAKTVEELLPVVYEPALVGPKIREAYQSKPPRAEGMDAFGVDEMIGFTGKVALVQVRTRGLEQKQMCLVETPDGWRVDWESWVGWSEMSWPAFLAEKPKRAVLFRVVLRETQYYNYLFADERRWKSYRLEAPDGEHAVFGYVEKGSLIDNRIRPAESSPSAPFILMLRFPPDADSSNQVIIDRVVADGWVEHVGKTKP